MEHKYILSGYNLKLKTLSVRAFNSIDGVIQVINFWFNEAGKQELKFLPSQVKQFEESVKASSSKGIAFPVDTCPLIIWRVLYV